MKTTNTMALSRRATVLVCCLLVESLAMCAETATPQPEKLKTSDVVSVLGPAAAIEVVAEALLEQPDLRKGLTIEVLLKNGGAEALELLDPSGIARIDLVETETGERVRPVLPTPFHDKRAGERGPGVIRLEPGQEHRFTLSITEIVRPRPAAAPATETAPVDDTSATMSSSPAADPSSPPPVAEALPAGEYRVTVLVSLAQPILPSGEVPRIRLITTEPVTVSYGPKHD